ncbi:MAG: DUF2200 domain-containing protein [Armatimonadetes bacterium]|nr:DUF2200 domain-containing protein [Armatimonadota bacterium]
MADERIHKMSLGGVYPYYLAKVEKKGRTQAELDEVILWMTGFTAAELQANLDAKTPFGELFAAGKNLNPARSLVTGVICGVRIEEITDPVVREVRILDKLVDELAKGRPMAKILRQP